MSYEPMGNRKVVAAADQTGLNGGNLTNSFPPNTLNVTQAFYEVYHIVIAPPSPGQVLTPAQCVVYVNQQPYSFTFPAGGSEWDPAEPMLLRSGDQVDFCWNLASSVTPKPVVTVYLRFDPALPGNVPYRG